MKVMIFGSNGMLGNYVKSYLHKEKYEIVPITRNDYDLSILTINSLRQFILSKLDSNDVIINCAGVIPQSKQLSTRPYFMINSLFPVILSMICYDYNIKMIHITTDCVFSGKDGNYNENSIPDEINDYGMSKSLGELCEATIIRTSIIGEEMNNKRSLLEWVKSNIGGEINGYKNHHWNGVTCLQLAKIIDDIIKNKLYWKGTRHIFSPNSVNKYELVSLINDIYDLNITIKEFKTENKIDKTLKTVHDLSFFKIPNLFDQIKEMFEFNL